MKKLQSSDRRKVLVSGLKAAGLALMGSFVWSAFLNTNTKVSLILRPPGALKEKEFLKSCVRCGLCVEACPFDTLKLSTISDNVPLGTPYFTPRDIPCEMCVDIPCVPVCPTNALDGHLVATLKDDVEVPDINKAKMGVAVVDTEHCIAFWGIRCEVCYRVCPLIDKAITLEYKRNERTGKHSFLLPIVNNEICTGCGKCEKACVTKEASIFVLPHYVFGESGTNYAKGWDEKDQQRLYDEDKGESKAAEKPLSTKGAQNYLNSEEF